MGLVDKLFPPASRERFAAKIARAIRRQGVEVEYDPAAFKLTSENGYVLFLENAYSEYRSMPPLRRLEVIRHYAGFVGITNPVPPDNFEDMRGDLLPRVRERFYHAANHLRSRIEGKGDWTAMFRPISEGLTIEVVHDMPTGMRILNKDTFDKWGIRFDDALKIARDNLWRRSNEDFLQPAPGLFISPWRDNYDCSRLALHDLIWQLKVKGAHVAAVPNRDLLIVTGSEDSDGLQKMAAIIEGAMNEPRFMTGSAVYLSGTQWRPFIPPEESPAHRPLREVEIKSVARDYREQHDLLRQLHEATGQDLHIAEYMAFNSDDGKTVVSRAMWLGGIPSLLPKTDELIVTRMNRDLTPASCQTVAWDHVAAAAGDLLREEPDCYPPRFRVCEIPGEEQLSSTGAVPISLKTPQ